MIFVRSRRSAVLIAAVTVAAAVGLVLATVATALRVSLPAASLEMVPAALAIGFAYRAAQRLRRWPISRIAFFRDRVVVVDRRTEVRAAWEDMRVVTLAEPNEWTVATWPEVRLTDRLTIHVRGERSFSVRPRLFGLDPVACRDLMLQLRDSREARDRLPEFDSDLDLEAPPRAVGELMKPRL